MIIPVFMNKYERSEASTYHEDRDYHWIDLFGD